MHWIVSFLLEHKNGSSLFVTVVISWMLINSGETQQQQITATLTTILFPIESAVNHTNKIRNLFAENELLAEQVAQLQMQYSNLKYTISTDSLQREFTHLAEEIPYELIQGEVISYEPVPIHRTMTINIGRKQGVRENMPVIDHHGVVGKVSMALSNCSRVQLMRMPDEKLSVLHEASGAIGILKSNDGLNLSIDVSNARDLTLGDTIVTSGLGGIYPPYLPVGTITDIAEAENPLYQRIWIRPFADLHNLRFINVISLESRWAPFSKDIKHLESEE
ncbi:rod shape-determining protein MreC [Chitinivibrio alkaliphilus]|uniref:Cell shape-determining protein MreC n=1 Tax=Chitinivibrio alkaliphilus ACht1 TaxID=1313304 RepID=U7D7R0_9BACT|nr:rod shape-determining protein MreC [Chitinivibrio alkaliphilus]ERP38990.1 rod shape-determining protein MreC [Chitinivibrio alkaliphilus ACht1]